MPRLKRQMLSKLLALLSPRFRTTIDVTPVPAARARVTRWGTYYPKTYKTWIREATGAIGPAPTRPFEGPVWVVVESICKRPQKLTNPFPVGDVDNYAKGPLDVLTKDGRFWQDDKQVVGLVSYKRYADKCETPGTHIYIEDAA